MSQESSLRQSGRTTRMLEEAAKLAKDGKYVFVIGLGLDWARLRDTFKHMTGGTEAGIDKIRVGNGSVVFLPHCSSQFDLISMTTPFSHNSCLLLIDHHVIESVFARHFEMMHRYDNKITDVAF